MYASLAELYCVCQLSHTTTTWTTYIFLLFVDMPDLKPDIFFSERTGRIVHNVPEALQNQHIVEYY